MEKKTITFKPTPQQLNRMKATAQTYNMVMDRLEQASQFKVGDYLIKYAVWQSYIDSKMEKRLYTNSYGVPVKYAVVHVEGRVPFCQKLTVKGNPVGEPECCVFGVDDSDDGHTSDYVFELDPDFADAIILDSTEEYDPSITHRTKRDTFKSVTDHNKASKVVTGDIPTLLAFLNGLNVGDTYWVSANNSMLVQEKELIRLGDLQQQHKSWRPLHALGPNAMIPVITVVNRKGIVKRLYPEDLYYKNVYTAKPRSYKEVRDLNL